MARRIGSIFEEKSFTKKPQFCVYLGRNTSVCYQSLDEAERQADIVKADHRYKLEARRAKSDYAIRGLQELLRF